MGGKEIEFEVERRREDRTPAVRKDDKDSKEESKKEEVAEEGSWDAYFQDPKTVDNMKFFVMAQSFVMFLTFGLPQVQKKPETMVDAMKIAHAFVVLLAMGGYSVMLFRGLNNHLTEYMYSSIEIEMEKNPHMKKDYEEYKAQLEEQKQEQKRQSDQLKELEEQAKKIQEQMEELSKKRETLKYIHIEGLNEIGIGRQHKEPPNQSREQQKRIEL